MNGSHSAYINVGGKFETAARYLNIKKSPTSLWHNKFVNDRQGKF